MKKLLLVLIILFFYSYPCHATEVGAGINAVRKGLLTPLQIRSIQSNSPAEKANIPLNWYIVRIDGMWTRDLTNTKCLELLNNRLRSTIVISPITTIYSEETVTLTLTNEKGFLNTVRDVPKTKGIGLGIYKYNLDLKMPLIITSVEKGSPAELAGIQQNTIILKINSQSTVELSVSECKKLLNSKKLELEVADLQGNNKVYKLRPTNYYANEIVPTAKENILLELSVKYNSCEKVLSEYFKIFKPEFVGDVGITTKELLERDKIPVENAYSQYETDKKNMEFNKYLYDGLNNFAKQYEEIIQNEINRVKEILVYSGKLDSSATNIEVLDYIKLSKIINNEYFYEYIYYLKNYVKICTTRAKEVKNYSVVYETKQKQSVPKVTTPYFIDNVDFREILWGWQNAKVPQKNGIYVISSGTGAYILQSVNGGLLVTAQPTRLSVNPRIIYILSKRQYADNDWIKDNLFMVFDGYYSYKNALGIVNKIYKFKEVPESEYWNRVQKKEYYFIK